MTSQWYNIAQQIKMLFDKDFVPLHEPTFTETEIDYVTDCIRTGWVSSVGKYVDNFEKKLAEYTGVKRAVAVVNGTAALHIALKIIGVKENDEVLMPALTFVATANASTYLQAVPHFVDVSEYTLGLNPEKLNEYIREIGQMKDGKLLNKQTGRIIRAVVPMHTFGHPVDLEPLIELCQQYNLALVEDAAESLGSYYKGKHVGGLGDAGIISFNGNKIITTGGGGAIITNNEKLADYAKYISTTAKIPHPWDYYHDEIGYNYRMPNVNAAIGCAQLEKMSTFVTSKRALAEQYEKLFTDVVGVEVIKETSFSKSNYWLQTIIIDPKRHVRDEVLKILNEQGVMSRPIWTPLNELNPYKSCPKSDLSVTKKLQKRIINIPSSPLKGRATL